MENFDKDYSLDSLITVNPIGYSFSFQVTPRFLNNYYMKKYEQFSSRLVTNFVKKCDLFIDVGAHYGFYSFVANESNKRIKIIAVEPIEENAAILKRNLVLNNIPETTISLIHSVAGNRIGVAEFYKSSASDNCSIFKHPNAPIIGKLNIPITTIDEILRNDDSGSLFIKIDTEGNELEVFKGMEKTFEKYSNLTLLIEINSKMLKLAETSPKEIVEYLALKGFNVYGIDDSQSKYYPLEDDKNLCQLETKNSFFNAICIKKEKALSVAFFSHSSCLGGAERSLVDLVEDLCTSSVLCSVLLPSDGPLKNILLDKGAAVYVLPEFTYWWVCDNNFFNEEIQKLQLTQALATTVCEAIPILMKLKPDVIYTQTIVIPWGALCAEILSIPHALSVCEYGELDHHSKFYFGFRESVKALYDGSETVFSITESVKNEVFKGISDKANKIKVVYRNVRLVLNRDFNAVQKDYDYKNKSEIKIAVFGTIHEGKGQEDIVRAGIELMRRGWKVIIYIYGYSNPQYLIFIKDLIASSAYKDNFIIKDFVNDSIEHMKGMDIVVSCSRNEAFGRTLLEAILLDVPIVYSNSGGPKEIFIDGKHGLAYKCADEHDLVEKLLFLIEHPDKTAQRVKMAKEYILDKFDSRNYSGKIESCLRRIKSIKLNKSHNLQTIFGIDFWVDVLRSVSAKDDEYSTRIIGDLKKMLAECVSQLEAEKTKNNSLEKQLSNAYSSVSYRIVEKLRRNKFIMAVYRFIRPMIKYFIIS